jgi:hypothetical protein
MKKIITVLLVLGLMNAASAQEIKTDSSGLKDNGPISVYINSPLGLLNKVRAKVEYRFKRDQSVLLSFAKYHGVVPGLQTYLEYRKYYRKVNKTELFFYGKAGIGKTMKPKYEIYKKSYVTSGEYGLFGAGVGQSFSFGKSENFSIQLSEGLKFLPVINGEVDSAENGFRGMFYVTGPGAIFDLSINLGWRF